MMTSASASICSGHACVHGSNFGGPAILPLRLPHDSVEEAEEGEKSQRAQYPVIKDIPYKILFRIPCIPEKLTLNPKP